MNALYAILLIGAAIILLPALVIGGGFILAILAVVALATLLFGGRQVIRIWERRQEGVSAAKVQSRSEHDDGRSWRDR